MCCEDRQFRFDEIQSSMNEGIHVEENDKIIDCRYAQRVRIAEGGCTLREFLRELR